MHGLKFYSATIFCLEILDVFQIKYGQNRTHAFLSFFDTHIYIYIYTDIHTSSTRTRRGGSCLKDIYETFLVYRTCMRRAPAKPVRACSLRKWCPVAHVTFEAPLRTSHAFPTAVFTLRTSHFTLHTSHCILRTLDFTLETSQSTLHTLQSPLHTSHCFLHTPHFTLHTPHFTLHSSHRKLHTSHFTLHTSHFKVHTSHFSLLPSHSTFHTSHSTLHTAFFTLHTSSYPSSFLLALFQLFSSYRENRENLLTNHYCSLHAATPIRFTRSSCKKQ